jgi:uncharacterized membrane protein
MVTGLVNWWRRWPFWIARAAVLWCIAYGALCSYWIFGGRAGFPFVNPDGEVFGTPAAARPVAVVMLCGCLAGAAAASGSATRRRLVLPGLIAGIIVALAGCFGLAISGVGAVATGTIEQPLAFLTELIAFLGAGLLVGTAQSWLRLGRGVCPRCGSRHSGYLGGPLVHPAPSASAAELRRTAYLMLLGVLPWATVKLIWGLGGDAPGMTAEEWRGCYSCRRGSAGSACRCTGLPAAAWLPDAGRRRTRAN